VQKGGQLGCWEQLEANHKAVLNGLVPVNYSTYIDMQPKVVFLTYICNLLYWIKSSINSCASSCVDIKRDKSLQGERDC
jgi:hypothetical protein